MGEFYEDFDPDDYKEHKFTGCFEDTLYNVHFSDVPDIRREIELHLCETMFSNMFFMADLNKPHYGLLKKEPSEREESTAIFTKLDRKDMSFPKASFKDRTNTFYFPEVKTTYTKGGSRHIVIWKNKNPFDIYDMSEHRKRIDKVTFNPLPPAKEGEEDEAFDFISEDAAGNSVLNLFQGFVNKPNFENYKERSAKARAYLFNVVCGGNWQKPQDAELLYKYLMLWLAHKIQKPHIKICVGLAMGGGAGSGKGTLAGKILAWIFEGYYVQLGKLEKLTGTYAQVDRTTLIAFMDEAVFTESSRQADELKTWITEENQHIERKYKDSEQQIVKTDFVFSTNRAQASNMDMDDRRIATFLVNPPFESVSKTKAYYRDLHNYLWNEGGAAALLAYLINYPVDDYLRGENGKEKMTLDVIPQTEYRISQLIMNLRGFEKFWYEVLSSETMGTIEDETGYWKVNLPFSDFEKVGMIPKKFIYEAFKKWSRGSRHIENEHKINAALKQLAPRSLTNGDQRLAFQNKNKYPEAWVDYMGDSKTNVFTFTTLHDLKREFAHRVNGVPPEWSRDFPDGFNAEQDRESLIRERSVLDELKSDEDQEFIDMMNDDDDDDGTIEYDFSEFFDPDDQIGKVRKIEDDIPF